MCYNRCLCVFTEKNVGNFLVTEFWHHRIYKLWRNNGAASLVRNAFSPKQFIELGIL